MAPGATAEVDGKAPGRKLDHDAPVSGGESRPVGRDPALVAVWPPGESNLQPGAPLAAARAGKDREDGAGTCQRPAGSNGFDLTCMRVWGSPSDVIVQERDERLACGRWCGGSRSDEGACKRCGDQHRGQPPTPPASAGGGWVVVSPAGHPVNRDG